MQPRAVHLADRRRSQRRRVEIGEQVVERLLELRLDRLAHDLRRRRTARSVCSFCNSCGERHADLVGPRAEDLAELDERRAQLFDRQPNPRLAAQMGERLAVAVLQEALHQRQVEPADPTGQPVLAEDREDLAPAIDVAIDLGMVVIFIVNSRRHCDNPCLTPRPSCGEQRLSAPTIVNSPPNAAEIQSRHRHEPACIQFHPPLQRRRQRFAVRHDDQNRVPLGLQFQQQFGDRPGRRAIEIAGRLVGQQQRRLADQRPGDRHPLPFAAGKLGRPMVEPLAPVRRGRATRPPAAGRPAVAAPSARNGTSTFSSTVHCGSNDALETRTRFCRLRNAASSASSSANGSSPPSRTLPEVGGSSVPRIDSSVLLPDPLGPRIARFSPRRSENDTPRQHAQRLGRRRIFLDDVLDDQLGSGGCAWAIVVVRMPTMPMLRFGGPCHRYRAARSLSAIASGIGIDTGGLPCGTRQQTLVISPVATSRPCCENCEAVGHALRADAADRDVDVQHVLAAGRRMKFARRRHARKA